jgi:hypothetical protein
MAPAKSLDSGRHSLEANGYVQKKPALRASSN